MKKFILIDHEPWTLRRKQLFYDLFEKAGIKLYVWDLSQWLYPGMSNPEEIKNVDYLTKIYNEDQFVECLRREDNQNTIIVEEVFRIWKNRKIFKKLSNQRFETIKIELYGHCGLNLNWKDKIKKLTLKNVFPVIKRKIVGSLLVIYYMVFKIKRPVRVFSSNSEVHNTDRINHPDYELYRFSTPKKLIDGKYIVFCDIFFPNHPDFKYFSNLSQICDANEYRNTMTRFFCFLEAKYHMPVIIAAHPKANYSHNEWEGRKVIKYETKNLVANADLVITHISGSVTFCLLYDKPTVFVGTNGYFKIPGFTNQMELLATRTLGLRYYNLDTDPLENIDIRNMNEQLRQTYIYKYLSSPETKDIPTWKILKNELNKL